MFQFYICKACKVPFAVSIVDGDKHLLKNSMRCPNSAQCQGKIRLTEQKKVSMQEPVRHVKARDLYAACLGMGLPHERKCGPKNLRKMLVGAKIADVHLEVAPDPSRSIIHSLTLDNGQVVHLAMSSKGATIFKVTNQPEKPSGRR